MEISIEPLGDQCVIVHFHGDVSPALCQLIHRLEAKVSAAGIDGVVECVPAYSSLAVYYLPWRQGFASLAQAIKAFAENMIHSAASKPFNIEIPTCYLGEFAPDLEEVAEAHSMSASDVVKLHSGAEYTVAMIGFSPGFPYLLGLPPVLATPRRAAPRKVVAAGSVGIGGSQTGIYPLQSPGGWNIIGRTPITLFDLKRDPPALLRAADVVKFVPIGEEEYYRLLNKADQRTGDYANLG